MPCRPERWWFGFLPLVVLWAGAAALLQDDLEAALGARVAGALGPADGAGSWARVRIDGRDAVLAGEAPSAEARAAAAGALAGLSGVRSVAVEASLAPTPGRIALTALRQGNAVRLQGFAPPGRRAAIVEAARAAYGTGVSADGLREAPGAPDGFEAAALIAVELLRHLPDGAATAAGPGVSVTGTVPDRGALAALRAAAAAAPPGIGVDLSGLVPPAARPYRVAVARSGERVRLEGYVPSEAARRNALAAAREALPDAAVEDGLELASGLPEGIDHGAALRFALAGAAELRSGSVELVDRRLAAAGEVVERDAAERLARLWRGLPAGTEAGPVRVRTVPASPFAFRVRRGADEVVLSGYLPDEATRDALLEVARGLFLIERLVDRTRLADGAPRGFRAVSLAAVELLAQAASGEAVLSDAAVAITGEVLYAQTAEQVRARAARLAPPGWTVRAEISGPESGRTDGTGCRQRAGGILARSPVRFVQGAELQRRSLGVLDDLAEALKGCPEAAIEVIGLPEAGAAPLERAQAVRDHLVRTGIGPERVAAVAAPEDGVKGADVLVAGPVAFRWR